MWQSRHVPKASPGSRDGPWLFESREEVFSELRNMELDTKTSSFTIKIMALIFKDTCLAIILRDCRLESV